MNFHRVFLTSVLNTNSERRKGMRRPYSHKLSYKSSTKTNKRHYKMCMMGGMYVLTDTHEHIKHIYSFRIIVYQCATIISAIYNFIIIFYNQHPQRLCMISFIVVGWFIYFSLMFFFVQTSRKICYEPKYYWI